MAGIPLLAPFADRLDEQAFYFGGKRYGFNAGLGNIHSDGAGYPIHGFLTFASDWVVTLLSADARGARGLR